MRTLSCLFLTFLLLFSASANATSHIELYDLQQRTADDIKPLILPLLQEGETVTGTGFKLILKAEPDRLEELKAIIGKLDARLHQLRISVRQGAIQQSQRSGAGIRGRIDVEDNNISASGTARILSTESRSDDAGTYQVTAMEGDPVFIAQGIRFPVTTTSTQIVNGRIVITPDTQYESASSGFYAKAWLQGTDKVMVELAPQREALVPGNYGAVEHSSLSTRVQGPLNEWIQIGGTARNRDEDGSGLAYQYSTQGRDDRQVWLKVEIIEP